MNKVFFSLFAGLIWVERCAPEKKPEQQSDFPPPIVSESKRCPLHAKLDSLPTTSLPYQPFDPMDQVKTYFDGFGAFGLYFVRAAFDFEPGLSEHRLKYHLMSVPYGEWLSIRRQFAHAFHVKGCTGFEIEIKVAKPAKNAELRLTICDVDRSGHDEMWWYDFDPVLLQNASDWVSLKIPFSDLDVAWQQGARGNDGNLDLTSIIAYEINLLSPSRQEAKGELRFRNLRVY